MIPGPRSTDIQGWLFPPEEETIDKVAAKRVVFGRLAEAVIEGMFDVSLLKTDGRATICPDARIGKEKSYMEIKSSGKGRGVLVYEWRFGKESKFAESEECKDFYYAVVRHSLNQDQFTSESEARRLIVEQGVKVHLLSIGRMREVLKQCGEPYEFHHIKSKPVAGERVHGTLRGGYSRGGWRIPYGLLKTATPEAAGDFAVKFYGQNLAASLFVGEEIPKSLQPVAIQV